MDIKTAKESLNYAIIPFAVGILEVLTNGFLGRESDTKLVLITCFVMAIIVYVASYASKIYVLKNKENFGRANPIVFFQSPIFWCTVTSVLILGAVLRHNA
ncbi:hypothetical protein PVT68_05170 [Microbulbifer bruguierae]|uniref:Uncharacterized protein n=1 Tax=Microbulbifer bruguierae TaxID=3029061 RepID=A0ABY8NFH0_9GAMM|nr:hypothetical protein [Microbulbifer bruguierae]WGL17685.1 hypothetical protein PVT68_05170 [Microbulbifer bruguierae]